MSASLAAERLAAIPVQVQGADRPGRLPGLAGWLEGFFVAQRERLFWVHLAFFLAFLALIFLPLLLPEPPEEAGIFDHFTRFANFALWGLWFPLVFLSVLFSGRSWCGLMCPMGAAAEWANRKGPQRPIPAWMRWEGTPILSFLLITLLGQTLGVRDHPEAIAEIFGGTLLIAILVGFFYGRAKRAWCRHLCPIGLLLGVFSRLGAVQFAPKKPKPGSDRWTEKPPCPTMIDLPRKRESRHCIQCFRCVHPKKRGGLFLRLRWPGEEIERIQDHHPNAYEVWFLFLGTGIALGGFLWLVLPSYWDLREGAANWFFDQGWFWVGEPGPAWLMSVHPDRREVFTWLDFFSISGFMLGWMLGLTALLASTTALSAWLAGRFARDGSRWKERFIALGYQYAPVAMVSLVLGLGAALFQPLADWHPDLPALVKTLFFLTGLFWSLWLGDRILQQQGLRGMQRFLPALPGVVGSLAVGFAWWPGIFGV